MSLINEIEMKNMIKLIDESMYQVNMIEQLQFGDQEKIKVNIFTDLKPLLDFVESLRQVETKMMRPIISDMKEKLVYKSINSLCWLEMTKFVTDVLTKRKEPQRIYLILSGTMSLRGSDQDYTDDGPPDQSMDLSS